MIYGHNKSGCSSFFGIVCLLFRALIKKPFDLLLFLLKYLINFVINFGRLW